MRPGLLRGSCLLERLRAHPPAAHVVDGRGFGVGDGEEADHLWKTLNLYRCVAYAYAVVLFVLNAHEYVRPEAAGVVLGLMGVWTLVLLRWSRRDALVMVLDLLVACASVLVTEVLQAPWRIAQGAPTLPTIWVSAAVLSWAVWRGWRSGLLAALVVAFADVLEVDGQVSTTTLHNIVILLLAGGVAGYTTTLYLAGRTELTRAVAIEAAARERERLAADIHDSVLQVLAYVRRRGEEVGGDAGEIGRLAGEQEVRLRSLVATGPVVPGEAGEQDLRSLLTPLARGRVTITGPAGPVAVSTDVAEAVVGAVRAALDNVGLHAGPGARAWVFLEDEDETVTVTVRDDGVGVAPGRWAEAEAEGRMGVSLSIRARVQGVGGHVLISSGPGEGTEVEVRVPRTGTRRLA